MLEVVMLFNDLSYKVCVTNKTENLDLSMFNMITGINESKILTKDISCKCKYRSDGKKGNSDQWWNNKCQCECKTRHVCEKDYVWNPATCSCENGKYLANIVDDSVIMCGEVIDAEAKLSNKETKTIPTNFNQKNVTCKIQNFYILLAIIDSF